MPTGPKGQKRPARRDWATIVHDMEWVVGMIDAYDRKLACPCDGRALETDFLFQLHPPMSVVHCPSGIVS